MGPILAAYHRCSLPQHGFHIPRTPRQYPNPLRHRLRYRHPLRLPFATRQSLTHSLPLNLSLLASPFLGKNLQAPHMRVFAILVVLQNPDLKQMRS